MPFYSTIKGVHLASLRICLPRLRNWPERNKISTDLSLKPTPYDRYLRLPLHIGWSIQCRSTAVTKLAISSNMARASPEGQSPNRAPSTQSNKRCFLGGQKSIAIIFGFGNPTLLLWILRAHWVFFLLGFIFLIRSIHAALPALPGSSYVCVTVQRLGWKEAAKTIKYSDGLQHVRPQGYGSSTG